MARTKKLTDAVYSPTIAASEEAIRTQIDDSIQEVLDLALADTTNRKLSPTGDFTGTINGGDVTLTEPGLSGAFNAHKAEIASEEELGHVKVDGITITADGNGVISAVTSSGDSLLKEYCINIKRNSFFNADPTNGTSMAGWYDRQILLLGDSHGWGQGGPNYQGVSAGYLTHTENIINNGFYGRLKKYLYEKFGSEPIRVVPFDLGTANSTVKTGSFSPPSGFVDTLTHTKRMRIVAGSYFISKILKSDFPVGASRDYMDSYFNAVSRQDSYALANYGHNVDVGFLSEFNATIGTGGVVLIDIDVPTRFVYLALVNAYEAYGKAEIQLLPSNKDFTVEPTGFGDPIYGTATPTVKINSTSDPKSELIEPSNVVITSNKITIDCSVGTLSNVVFIIDFGQKKCGTLKITHGGNGVNTTLTLAPLSTSAINVRGALLSNGDTIKNWSMGGHTIGAWIGEQSNYDNSETKDHLADILNYTYRSVKGCFIQLPIVNEVIKQTPIVDFKSYLDTLKTRLGTDNLVLFTTLGRKALEFDGGTTTITNDDYVNAAKEWVTLQGGNVTFVDCRAYLKSLVSDGIIPAEDLYTNDSHPSPSANEIIFDMLKQVSDMKF
jgi:hypothetical protein